MALPLWIPALGRQILVGLGVDAVINAGKESVKNWFSPPLSSGEIPPHLRNNWGDGGEKSNGNDPTVPPETPINNPPPVWTPPRKIYQPDADLPLRRLPTEGDGQTDINVSNQKAITVKQAIKDREFGRLIPSPVSNKRLKIRLQVNRDIGEEVAALQSQAIERFGTWFGARMAPAIANTPDYLQNASLWDAFCLVSPKEIAGFKGDIDLIYGVESLKAIANYYRTTSRNAFIGVVDAIPTRYDVRSVEIDTPETVQPNPIRLIEVYGTAGLAGLLGQVHMGYKVPKDLTRMPTPEQLDVTRSDLYEAARWDDYKYRESIGQLGEDEESATEVEIRESIEEEIEDKWYDRIWSHAEYQAWFTRQVDALAGQFPIDILIEDNDLIQTGDQPIQVRLPNIADTLAEMIRLGITQQSLTEANTEIMLRALIEGGADRQLNFQSLRLLESIVDYLGFKTKKKTETVPFTFNPFYPNEQGDDEDTSPENDPNFIERLSDALRGTDVKIETEEIDDDGNLEKTLAILVEAARIIKAVHFRKWDESGFKREFKDLLKFLNGENDDPNRPDDWDKWVEDFENGFPGQVPDSTTRPWGKDFAHRPKVKDSVPERDR